MLCGEGDSWAQLCVGEVMVDPFMRIKGATWRSLLATRRYLWGHGGGAFRREKATEVPEMVMVVLAL